MSVWGRQVSEANAVLMGKTKLAVVKVISEVSRSVIQGTPVDKGMLINNWYAANTSPSKRKNKSRDPSGKKSIGRVAKALRRLKLGQTFYLTNNLPYAAVVEYGRYPNPSRAKNPKTRNGFSKQAPAGMMRLGLRRALQKIRSAP